MPKFKPKQHGHLFKGPTPPFQRPETIAYSLLMAESYKRLLNRPLVPEDLDPENVAEWLWLAPFGLLSHDTQKGDPTFVYANAAALTLFETTWEEIYGTASTKSAAPINKIQDERSMMLEAAKQRGYYEHYSGKRVGFQGTKFTIQEATLFNVSSPTGKVLGQGALLQGWEYEDGRPGRVPPVALGPNGLAA